MVVVKPISHLDEDNHLGKIKEEIRQKELWSLHISMNPMSTSELLQEAKTNSS